MGLRGVLVTALLLVTLLSGCTEPKRDLETDAADREEWAREHQDHDPVARLTGPAVLAPGALAWYSAQGSHDPDFIGAKSERREAASSGGVHYSDHYADVTVSWSDGDSGTRGLGPGIREYQWQVDDGPMLVAPELTYRYGTEDGPVRIPIGFAEPGEHTLTLTVVDWSGARDRVRMELEVAEGGLMSGGDLEGWTMTAEGWARTAMQTLDLYDVGRCPAGRDTYDAARDRLTMPWELLFFADSLTVTATWDRLEGPAAAPTFPRGLTAGLPVDAAPAPDASDRDAYGINTNDIDMTLGHCARDGEWSRFATESPITDETPSEGGTVDAMTFAQHVARTGNKAAYVAEWDHDVYLSGEGEWRGGTGTDVHVTYSFRPAVDTSGGAL